MPREDRSVLYQVGGAEGRPAPPETSSWSRGVPTRAGDAEDAGGAAVPRAPARPARRPGASHGRPIIRRLTSLREPGCCGDQQRAQERAQPRRPVGGRPELAVARLDGTFLRLGRDPRLGPAVNPRAATLWPSARFRPTRCCSSRTRSPESVEVFACSAPRRGPGVASPLTSSPVLLAYLRPLSRTESS